MNYSKQTNDSIALGDDKEARVESENINVAGTSKEFPTDHSDVGTLCNLKGKCISKMTSGVDSEGIEVVRTILIPSESFERELISSVTEKGIHQGDVLHESDVKKKSVDEKEVCFLKQTSGVDSFGVEACLSYATTKMATGISVGDEVASVIPLSDSTSRPCSVCESFSELYFMGDDDSTQSFIVKHYDSVHHTPPSSVKSSSGTDQLSSSSVRRLKKNPFSCTKKEMIELGGDIKSQDEKKMRPLLRTLTSDLTLGDDHIQKLPKRVKKQLSSQSSMTVRDKRPLFLNEKDDSASLMTFSWCPSSASDSSSSDEDDDGKNGHRDSEYGYFEEDGCLNNILQINLILDSAGKPWELEHLLFASARKNDVITIRLLVRKNNSKKGTGTWMPRLSAGLDPDLVEVGTGRTPLWYAACSGSCESIIELHKLGGSLSTLSNCGVSPLHIAVLMNRQFAVQSLLELGAVPDQINHNGTSTAWFAASEGFCKMLKVLISYGANVDLANNLGVTPALIAAEHGDIQILEILGKSGADFQKKTKTGDSCITIACKNNKPEIIRLLTYIMDDNTARYILNDPSPEPPLYIAAELGHKEVFSQLLKSPVCISDSVNSNGISALFVAARDNHVPIVRSICSLGAERLLNIINFEDNVGHTPVFVATIRGHVQIVKLLASSGANLEKPFYEHESATGGRFVPLLLAGVLTNHIDVVRVLLECGADVNITDENDHTALNEAAKLGNVDMCRLLVSYNANEDIRTKKGKRTALQKAKKYKHSEVADFLERRHSAPDHCF
mmetsp:Transcript_21578/g.49050  ORF Transcript_21578/g.49050 Transcript_21578/m.49050 type:complete len:785 (-) Transcript_21578:264-2618(-)